MDNATPTQKSGHGGARPGAGRKKKEGGRRITITMNVSERANAGLLAEMQRRGCSRTDVVNDLLEALPLLY